jgi:hypothetical protein
MNRFVLILVVTLEPDFELRSVKSPFQVIISPKAVDYGRLRPVLTTRLPTTRGRSAQVARIIPFLFKQLQTPVLPTPLLYCSYKCPGGMRESTAKDGLKMPPAAAKWLLINDRSPKPDSAANSTDNPIDNSQLTKGRIGMFSITSRRLAEAAESPAQISWSGICALRISSAVAMHGIGH